MTTQNQRVRDRVEHWQETLPAVRQMGWLGSGLGSYRYVHRQYRTKFEEGVFYYAENNFLQAGVEGGWPALLLYVSALGLALYYSVVLVFYGNSAGSIGPGMMGIFLISSQSVASFFDFGLYLPANLLLMGVLTGILAYHSHSLAGRLKRKLLIRWPCPNWFVQVALLIVFAGVSIASLDYFKRWSLDNAMSVDVSDATPDTLTIEETEKKISNLSKKLGSVDSIRGLNYLGDLWVHRSRLQFFNKLKDLKALDAFTTEDRQATAERIWRQTKPARVQETINLIGLVDSQYSARKLASEPFVQENYLKAAYYYDASRARCPLQPFLHKDLGILQSALGFEQAGSQELVRAVEIAPGSTELTIAAGSYFMRNGKLARAAEYFKRTIELSPLKYKNIRQRVSGVKGTTSTTFSDRQFFEMVIPDSPALLFEFAQSVNYNEDLKNEALDRADSLLYDVDQSKPDQLLLGANVKLARGDVEQGLELLGLVLIHSPGDDKSRFRYANILLRSGRLDEAKKESDKLCNHNSNSEEYQTLREKVQKALDQERERRRQSNSDSDLFPAPDSN